MVCGIYPFLHLLVPFSAVQALIWSFLLTALTAKCKGKLPAAIYLYLTGFRGKKGLSRNVSWNLRGDSYLHRMPPPQSFKAIAHAQKKPCISASCKWTPIPIPFPSLFFSCLFLLRSPFVFFLHGSRRSLSMIYPLQLFQDHRPPS